MPAFPTLRYSEFTVDVHRQPSQTPIIFITCEVSRSGRGACPFPTLRYSEFTLDLVASLLKLQLFLSLAKSRGREGGHAPALRRDYSTKSSSLRTSDPKSSKRKPGPICLCF